MIYGIAFSPWPKNWGLGWSDAYDYDADGREIIIGRWFFLGPVAITFDYE